MDLFPSIFEVPSAVILERLALCLVVGCLSLFVRVGGGCRAVMIACVFAVGYLSVYFTWWTFVFAG